MCGGQARPSTHRAHSEGCNFDRPEGCVSDGSSVPDVRRSFAVTHLPADCLTTRCRADAGRRGYLMTTHPTAVERRI